MKSEDYLAHMNISFKILGKESDFFVILKDDTLILESLDHDKHYWGICTHYSYLTTPLDKKFMTTLYHSFKTVIKAELLEQGKDLETDKYKGMKLSAYSCMRAKKMRHVFYTKISEFYYTYYGIDPKLKVTLKKIQCRTQTKNFDTTITKIMRNFNKQQFNWFISDMLKLPAGFAQYLFEYMGDYTNFGRKPVFQSYEDAKQEAPTCVKKCKYPIHFSKHDIHDDFEPKTRLQYFMAKAYSLQLYHMDYEINEIKKLLQIDSKAWKTFAESTVRGARKKHYSIAELRHLIQTVYDGCRLKRYACNETNYITVKGSPNKLIQRAIYNHRMERVNRLKHAYKQPNLPLPQPPTEFPNQLEEHRIKTTHDLIKAGIECEHCIGNYINSSDIFIRKGDICAQISRNPMRVIQCYDKFDRITDESKKFESTITTIIQSRRNNETNQV